MGETQEEACDPCPQGSESFHQRAMRFQGEACFEDRARVGDEEVEGVNQLSGREWAQVSFFEEKEQPTEFAPISSKVFVDELWWAVSPSSFFSTFHPASVHIIQP